MRGHRWDLGLSIVAFPWVFVPFWLPWGRHFLEFSLTKVLRTSSRDKVLPWPSLSSRFKSPNQNFLSHHWTVHSLTLPSLQISIMFLAIWALYWCWWVKTKLGKFTLGLLSTNWIVSKKWHATEINNIFVWERINKWRPPYKEIICQT